MSTGPEHTLRIGDVARLVGTTARTIRYYEEIGLLPQAPERPRGGHRLYTEADVAHLREVVRLRDLLGLSLEELKALVEAEQARARLRALLARDDVAPEARRALIQQGLAHLERQLALVRRRTTELARLEQDLVERQQRGRRMLRELRAQVGGAYPPNDLATSPDDFAAKAAATPSEGHAADDATTVAAANDGDATGLAPPH